MVIRDDPAAFFGLDESSYAIVIRLLSYEHEHARHRKVADFACSDVLQHEVLNHSIALDFFDNCIVDRFNLRVSQCLSDCCSVGSELITAVNDVDF